MDTSLKQLKTDLVKISNSLKWDFEPIMSGNQQFYLYHKLLDLRKLISDVKKINLFPELISELVNSAIYTTSNDDIKVVAAEHLKIIASLSLLKDLINGLLDVLSKIIPSEKQNSINIKLPPVDDFDELSKVSREIHLALSQVILDSEIGGETKIESVENGSIWLNVYVGSVAAVSLIASLVWAATVIYKKKLEGEMLAEQLRSLKIRNESAEEVLAAQRTVIANMVTAEAEHIQSEHFKENASENIEKLKNSIVTFADLINKGAEIHPALVAPENVSNLFPNPTKLIGVESKIKKLPEA